MHLMIDLETLGTSSQPPLLQISAATFDPMGEGWFAEFNIHVDVQSCLDLGTRIEWGTIEWWLKQSDEARRNVLNANRQPIRDCVVSLFLFAKAHRVKYVWSHGLSFDIPIISAYARRLDIREPWSYKDVRDTRTLFDLVNINVWEAANSVSGPTHDAVVDVRKQVIAVQTAYRSLKGGTG